MTNYEWLKSMSVEELGHELCRISECERCPVSDKCELGKNGYITWLKEENKDG